MEQYVFVVLCIMSICLLVLGLFLCYFFSIRAMWRGGASHSRRVPHPEITRHATPTTGGGYDIESTTKMEEFRMDRLSGGRGEDNESLEERRANLEEAKEMLAQESRGIKNVVAAVNSEVETSVTRVKTSGNDNVSLRSAREISDEGFICKNATNTCSDSFCVEQDFADKSKGNFDSHSGGDNEQNAFESLIVGKEIHSRDINESHSSPSNISKRYVFSDPIDSVVYSKALSEFVCVEMDDGTMKSSDVAILLNEDEREETPVRDSPREDTHETRGSVVSTLQNGLPCNNSINKMPLHCGDVNNNVDIVNLLADINLFSVEDNSSKQSFVYSVEASLSPHSRRSSWHRPPSVTPNTRGQVFAAIEELHCR